MSLASVLTDIKSRLNALLTFANSTTGSGDTSIGDAIETLCSGYGGGATMNHQDITLSADTRIEGYQLPFTTATSLIAMWTDSTAHAPSTGGRCTGSLFFVNDECKAGSFGNSSNSNYGGNFFPTTGNNNSWKPTISNGKMHSTAGTGNAAPYALISGTYHVYWI